MHPEALVTETFINQSFITWHSFMQASTVPYNTMAWSHQSDSRVKSCLVPREQATTHWSLEAVLG